MKGFIFNFSPVKKKEKRQYTPSNKDGIYNIIKKDVEAIINIDNYANYTVLIISNGHEYNIISEAFNCSNQKIVYKQDLKKNEGAVKYIRGAHINVNLTGYLPFFTGVRVRGNIVELAGITYFSPKSYFTRHDYYYDLVWKNYIENYKIINKHIKEKIKNNKWV